MTLGIVSAMHEELSAVLARVRARPVEWAGRTFWQGHWHGVPVVAVLSRIGKVAAATTVTTLLHRFEVDQVVMTGVAGGLAESVQVGDAVVADAFMQHDLDASPLFPRYEVPLYGVSRFGVDARLSGWLMQAAQEALSQADGHVALGELTARAGGGRADATDATGNSLHSGDAGGAEALRALPRSARRRQGAGCRHTQPEAAELPDREFSSVVRGSPRAPAASAPAPGAGRPRSGAPATARPSRRPRPARARATRTAPEPAAAAAVTPQGDVPPADEPIEDEIA